MEEEGHDMISNLPSEIQKLIVSSIPLKEAVRTSILSTTWRSLWTPLQVNLDLGSTQITSHEATEKLKEIMGMFLRSNDSPRLLKLSIISPKNTTVSAEFVHEGFAMAIKGTDKDLQIDFANAKQAICDFNLILNPSCPSHRHIHSMQTTSFSSLKTLHLTSITHLAENFVSSLFSSFWLLESLKLEKCSGLRKIDIKGANSLRNFVMKDCPNIISITLSAPNLKSFWYRGVLPNIELKNTPYLVDMVLDLKDGSGQNEFDCEDVLYFLSSLKDIEILTISGWLLEWLCGAGVIFERLDFGLNKLKELCCLYSLMNRPLRDSLACFLNMTPNLEKLFVNIDQSYIRIPCPFFHQYWHEPHLWMDYATVKCNAAQLKHLNIINLSGFTSEKDQLLLMDLLLHKALKPESMTVSSPENRSWSVAKIPQTHLNMTQRFQQKVAVASPANMAYSFVLTEKREKKTITYAQKMAGFCYSRLC
ncbi:unnamed protein product [Ilex paraguariensis]|uniref:F-box domain-containing protein n=1 Tax=Ilex paraguariensis TaxID=185542 RepID=A0ABC8RR06_9AQUA